MMLAEFLPEIFERSRTAGRVLDVGGAVRPLNTATHILDVLPFDKIGEPISPHEPIRYSEGTGCFVVHDICSAPWPFPNDYFDFSFCAQTLEDVRDPIGACLELMRVSRQGYIEVPSRLRESFHFKGGYFWRRILGRPIRVGFGHHRWLCELHGNTLTFLAKTHTLIYSPKYFITRDELGRDLTSQEANIGLFWTRGQLEVCERLLVRPGEIEADFIRFKAEALAKRS